MHDSTLYQAANPDRFCASENPVRCVCCKENSDCMQRRKHTRKSPISGSATEWLRLHQGRAFLILSGTWAFFLYWRALFNPFSSYDDFPQIVDNPALGTWQGVSLYLRTNVWFTHDFATTAGSYYRPLYWVSLALDRKLWGLHPFGFHLTNLLLHWVNSVLLFYALKRLRIPWQVATATPLLWLALPINSEVVAWIASRAYCLAAFFLLISVLCAQQFLEKRQTRFVAFYSLAAFCALLSHEGGILVLPLTILAASKVTEAFRRIPVLLDLAGVAVAALWLGLKHLTGGSALYYRSPALLPAGAFFFKYLGWMIAPVHMSIERSSNAPADILSLQTVLAWAGLLGILMAAFFLRRKWPVAAAGLIWMSIAILPFCGVVPIYQGMAERFLYYASAGLALGIVAFCYSAPDETRSIVVGVVALWALWGVWRLHVRLIDWSDPVLLYQSSLQASPNSTRLLYNLGAIQEKDGDLMHADLSYRAVLQRDSRFERALAGLGNVRLRRNDPRHAAEFYQRALSLKPDDDSTITNYAAALAELGDKAGAGRQYRRAIALSPMKDDAYCGLGVLLFQQGDTQGATGEFLKAQSLDGSDATPYYDLGSVYEKLGQATAAADEFRKALELDPGDPETIAALHALGAM
jgi:protein O-mannosyl-transferase